jgi:hypothetical protein
MNSHFRKVHARSLAAEFALMDALTEYYEGGRAPIEEEARATALRTEIKELWSTMVPQAVIERAQALALIALPGAVPVEHHRYQGMVKHPSGLMLYVHFDNADHSVFGDWVATVQEGCTHIGLGSTPEAAIEDLRRYLKYLIEEGQESAKAVFERVFPGES